jgi:hypothetical protein
MTKQLHLPRLAVVIACGAFGLFPAVGADSVRVGSYDFGYAASGDTRARPVQVFDDGRSTFFQFRAGDPIPAIFSHPNGTPQLLVPMHEGPYVKVADVHGRFVLQVGRSQANVIHAGGSRADAPQLNVVGASGLSSPHAGGPVPDGSRLVASLAPVTAFGPPDDAAHRNSYATPRKGDAVVWTETEPTREELSLFFARGSAVLTTDARKAIAAAAKAAGLQTRFVVIGRDDDTLKEGLDQLRAERLHTALTKAGVDPSRISSRVGVAGKPRGAAWPSTIHVETERVVAIRDKAPPAPAAVPAPRVAEVKPPPATTWAVRAVDENLEKMFERWALTAGWKVVWRNAPHIRITGDMEIAKLDFLQAADMVITQSKSAGYRIQARAFSNQVLLIEGTPQ